MGEFVKVEAIYLCRLSSKIISYAIVSWSVSFELYMASCTKLNRVAF